MRILAPKSVLFALTLASLSLSQLALAVDYNTGSTTSNTQASPDSWNSGTNWDATPVSGLNTILNISISAGSTYMVNDIAGTFHLNLTTVAKTGTGTWTLSGENTYSGGTSINDGTLVVNNTVGWLPA